MWQLTSPTINTSKLLIDEAQDLNPVMFDVIKQQVSQKIYVGDKHQQIYGWRGALNAMEFESKAENLSLNQSFRFGPELAQLATNILQKIDKKAIVTGNEKLDTTVCEPIDKSKPYTKLFRTNTGILHEILSHKSLSSLYVQGGVNDLTYSLQALENLLQGRNTFHPLFIGFNTVQQVREYAELAKDKEIQRLLNIADTYSTTEVLNKLSQLAENEQDAHTILSTAHKSKGCEWDSVIIAEDFKDPEEDDFGYNFQTDESRLLYVACTRAKNHLELLPNWANDAYL